MFLTSMVIVASMLCNGVDNDTPAFDNAVQEAREKNVKTILIPSGVCEFDTQPVFLDNGLEIRGQGKSNTVLRFNVSNASFIRLRGQGVKVADLSLSAGPNTNGSIGIAIQCDNGPHGCGNHMLEHMWITSLDGATWGVPLNIDGARTVPPVGARAIHLSDVTVFNGEYWSAVFSNCQSCEWFGGGAYLGAGLKDGVWVGNGSSNVRIDANINKGTSVLNGMRSP